jgi:uncharacterized protein YjdB
MKARIEVLSLVLLAAACNSQDRLAPPAAAAGSSSVAVVSVVRPSVTALPVGSSLSLSAQVSDGFGVVLAGHMVTWTSNDTTQATVVASDPMGREAIVTGIGAGNAVITAASEGRSGTIVLTILGPPAALSLSPSTQQLPKGGSYGLTALVQDAAGNLLPPNGVAYSTSDTTVAVVDSLGVVTAVGLGTATITATVAAAIPGIILGQQRNFISRLRSFHALGRNDTVRHDDFPAPQLISATAMVTVADSPPTEIKPAGRARP